VTTERTDDGRIGPDGIEFIGRFKT